MSVNIKVKNSSFGGNSEVLNDIQGRNLSIELDSVKIDNAVKMLNNITDTEAEDMVNVLLAQQQCLNSTDPEYQILQNMRSDMQQSNYKIKDLLKKYMPNLITSTLANILGKHIL